MRAFKIIAPLLLITGSLVAQRSVIAQNPAVITGKLVKIASPGNPDPTWKNVPSRNERGIIGRDEGIDNNEYEPTPIYNSMTKDVDKAVQTAANGAPSGSVNSGFGGMGYTAVCPADPTMAVGPNHVLQMINGSSGAYFQIWNKTGTVLKAQSYMDAFTGKGGLGDPIALYDQLADRFVMTEFANKSETGSYGLIIAVSKTSDPTGLWSVYFYATTLFPDYPKYSVWSDAYYCKTNDFKQQRYNGATIWAFDRTAMLNGNSTATAQKFAMGTANKYYSMCPVGLSGTTTPPAGTGGLFAYLNDNSWSGSASDSVGILECDVNFTTPSLSKVVVAKSMAVNAYSLGSGNVPQPNNGQGLDALRNRVMNQPQYRNFGTYQSLVLAHVADVVYGSKSVASARWYELRNAGSWSVYQQQTYSPTQDYRFIPSININANGEIGMIYNVTNATNIYPSIKFVYHKPTDPLNTMSAEGIIVSGTASSNCYNRYGDYNHVVVDPSNNTTFWCTGMYNTSSSWSTYVASFTTTGTVGPLAAVRIEPDVTPNELKASVYPNPAGKQITLTVNEEAQMKMVDFNGKSVLSRVVQPGANKIDIGSYAPGVYIIRLNSKGKEGVLKFVKEQ